MAASVRKTVPQYARRQHASRLTVGQRSPYLNRELSQIAFNERVLAQSHDRAMPLLERLRFLCIVSSNLDEFFEIRVAGLREQLRVKAPMVGTTLHELKAHIGEIGQGAQALVAAMYRTLNGQILPALTASGVRMLRSAERNAAQRAWVADYFQREIRPLLTPIGLDPAHPFPQVVNKSLNFIVELSGRDAFGRETSVAKALMFCASVCRSGGTEAF